MNKSETLFSVIVTFRGLGDSHLASAMASLESQRFKGFDVVLVNRDGILDTRAGLPSVPINLPLPIKAIGSSNVEHWKAINDGAVAGAGRYLAFLSSEDTFHADRLEVFRRAIHASDEVVRWGFSGVDVMDVHGDLISAAEISDPDLNLSVRLSRTPLEAQRLLGRLDVLASPTNLVVERNLFNRVGGCRGLAYGWGWELALRLDQWAEPFVAERPLYAIRWPEQGHPDERARSRRQRRAVASAIAAEYQDRLAGLPPRDPLTPRLGEVSPDQVAAIRAALWGLRRLRAVPVAYGFVRGAIRMLRRIRGLLQ